MKKLSKILVLVLAVALICTGLVLAVSADDTTVDLAAAIDNAVADDNGMTTVTLEGNATLDTAYTVAKDLTIDLNGYTLTSSAEDAFVIESAVTVKIIGDGTINLAGRLVKSSTVGAGYTFTVEGTTGIDVNFTGTAAANIVHAAGGTHTFTKVNIVSTRAQSTVYNAIFRGTLDAESNTANGTASGLKFYFNSSSYYSDIPALAQNDQVFIMPTGSGSYVEMNNTNVLNGGTLLYFGYTTEDSINDVLCNIYNSNLQIHTVYNEYRSCLVWAHKGNGSDMDLYGTVNLYGSYIGGNSYRAVHGSTGDTEKFQVVLDNSTMANNGANDENNKDRDTKIVRGVLVYFKNNSALVSYGTSLLMSSGIVKAEVGTRFANATTAGSGHITWVDSNGASVSDVTVALDPVGSRQYPYVSTLDASSVVLPGEADAMKYFPIEFGYGYGSGSQLGWRADKLGSYALDWEKGWQAGFFNGTLTDRIYGSNTSFKYYVQPTTDYPTLGGNRIFPSNYTDEDGNSVKEDVWMIFGTNNALTAAEQISHLSTNEVVVSDFDFGTDSEYGFPRIAVKSQARIGETDGSDASGDTQFRILNDGSISNGNLVNFNSSIRFNKETWNHITCVMYTDSVLDEDGSADKIGQAFYYINGEFLGYSNYAFKSTAGYVMGTRFTVEQNVNQKVGSSMLIDNISLRAYNDYLGENEADGAVKSPELYLLNDFYKNTTPTNNKITVAGKAYGDINEAIKAAVALGVNVELHDDINEARVITENGTIDTNGYKLAVDPASYGFVVDGDKYTFNEDYWYNAYWYNGALKDVSEMADDANYVKEVVKLGFELDHENLFTEETKDFTLLQSVTQDGWAYDYLATEKVTALVPTLAELEVAKTDASRAVRFYPVITAVDMTYCIKNAGGEVIDGGVNAENATAALKALADGNTLVLLADLPLTESNLLFASTADAPKVLNVDLNGHNLIRTVSGVLVQVGAYTTLNVYSSVAGANVIVPLVNASGTISDGGTAFVISDGTNNSAETNANTLVETRGDVNEAYINVGKFGDIPGSNMTVIAERAYYGFKGGENCAIVADGVNVIAPGTSSGCCAVESYVYDGEIYVKNSILLVPEKDNVVNLTGFSANCKNAGARKEGFEDFIITSYTEFENVIIINKLAGLSNGANNNVISNNGDTSSLIEGGTDHIALKFKNVVSTGRLNPSNEAARTRLEGFVAAETHGVGQCVEGTRTGNYNYPMSYGLIDELGITSDVQNFALSGYSTETGEVTNVVTYNIANNGVSVEGLANAYVLPILDRTSGYSEDFVYVNWKKLDGSANALSEVYYKGGIYKTLAADDVPAAATVNKNAVSLIADGAWTGIPAAGTVMTENVTVTHAYKVQPNVSGLKANLSLYSDFVINVYIPENYAQYITSVNGAALAGDIVTIGENNYYKVTASKVAKEASDVAVFEIALAEGGYTATKTVSVSITDYASTILAGEFTDADKVLMYNMLSFAHAAFKYFNDAEDDTIAALLETYAAWNKVSVDKSYGNALADTGLGDVFTSAGIVLGDAPAFTLVPNGNFAGTVTVTYGDGNVRTYTVQAGSVEAIKIEGMKIFNFGVNVNITAAGTLAGVEQTVSGTLNLDTYAEYQTANAEENVVAIVEALYNYVKIAEQYKAGTLVIPEA